MIGRSESTIIGLVITLACASCRHAPETHAVPATVARDSLTGIVAVTGTSFEKRLVLRSGQRSTTLSANTTDSASLTRVAGAEVRVRGQADSSAFLVSSFTVVSVDNRPVVDGVLRTDGAKISLETALGRMSLGNPPTALRGMPGARVWIGGPLDVGPNVYGIVTPPR